MPLRGPDFVAPPRRELSKTEHLRYPGGARHAIGATEMDG
jgi:hypothetical protein